MFLFGEMVKFDVCKFVLNVGLVIVKKKDFVGICFIGEKNFKEFLGYYLLVMFGKMMIFDGQVKGEYVGLMYYMIGQCCGFGIGGDGEDNELWFVVGKDLKKNILYVGKGYYNLYLYVIYLKVFDLYFVIDEDLGNDFYVMVKFCYW